MNKELITERKVKITISIIANTFIDLLYTSHCPKHAPLCALFNPHFNLMRYILCFIHDTGRGK